VLFKRASPWHRRRANGSHWVLGKEVELHDDAVGKGGEKVVWLERVEVNADDGRVVEQALGVSEG
jgi:hypothetical protein